MDFAPVWIFICIYVFLSPAWACLYCTFKWPLRGSVFNVLYFIFSFVNIIIHLWNLFWGNCLFGSNSRVHHSNALGLPLAQKSPHVCFGMQYVCLTIYVLCCSEWGYWKPTLFQNIYRSHYHEYPTKIFWVLSFSLKRQTSYPNPKHYSTVSGKAKSLLWTK